MIPSSRRAFLDGLSVLIVDDNPVVLLASRACIQPLGLDVVCVDSGDAALRRLAERSFDAVLMDLHMPGRDGFETTARIRAAGAGRGDLPVIALSATAEGDDLRRCRDAAMNACLEKPLDPGLLAEALERLCRPGGVRRDGAWTWIGPAAQAPADTRPTAGSPPVRPPERPALHRLEQALEAQIARHGFAHPLTRALMRAAGRLPVDLEPALSPSGR